MSDNGPRISIVIPVYRVEAFIEKCLESLTDQHGSFEVVVVDDASDDRSMARAEPLIRRLGALVVVHPRNRGLGAARNSGIDASSGDYVAFVDSDDWLAPGAVKAWLSAIEQWDDPEIVLFDYRSVFSDGTSVRNENAPILIAQAGMHHGLSPDSPLLKNFHVAWNKLYRRSFLERIELRFPEGFYEDVPWSYPALLLAESVAVVPADAYRYRREGQSSILQTTSLRHLDLFDQYDRLFELADRHSAIGAARDRLRERMFVHIAGLAWRGQERLPRSARVEFVRRSAKALRLHGAPRLGLLSPRDRIRLAVLQRGLHRSYQGLLRLANVILWIRRQQFKERLSHARCRFASEFGRRMPIDHRLAVFDSYWGRGMECNPAAVAKAQAALRPDVRTKWLLRHPPRNRTDSRNTLRYGSARAAWNLARAGVIVSNVNLPYYVPHRVGAVHVQTHHGTPMKFMGQDLLSVPAGTDLDVEGIIRNAARFDVTLGASPHAAEVWERAFPGSGRVVATGSPRNDELLSATTLRVKQARQRIGVDGVNTVLYAPTYRDRWIGDQHISAIAALLEADSSVEILLRLHPLDANELDLSSDRVHDVGRSSVNDVLLAADQLVTDYSSIVFDFALLDRPISLFVPDIEEYSHHRGLYLDARDGWSPGPTVFTPTELRDAVATRVGSDPDKVKRHSFVERFCAWERGDASVTAVAEIWPSPVLRRD